MYLLEKSESSNKDMADLLSVSWHRETAACCLYETGCLRQRGSDDEADAGMSDTGVAVSPLKVLLCSCHICIHHHLFVLA